MKVIVTGGRGFIGSHVRARLAEKGHEWLAFDRSDGFDVLEAETWQMFGDDIDAVIHLAGVLGTAELFDTPMIAVDTNIKGTINALNFCRDHDARFIEIVMPDCWENVYQATKHCAQKLATAWHRAFEVPTVSVCAYNVYGAGQAHGPGHPQKIIPTFATAAALGKPIPIWGDGRQFVDLISATDVAKVLVAALETPGDDEIIDAGTTIRQTVFQVAQDVWRAARPEEQPILQFHPMRLGETSTSQVATVATGRGWQHLDPEDRPHWDSADLAEVVRWYVEHGTG